MLSFHWKCGGGWWYNELLCTWSCDMFCYLPHPLSLICLSNRKKSQFWLLSHSYSMAWFEYCFNTHQEIIIFFVKGLLNFKISFCHNSRLVFFFFTKIDFQFGNGDHWEILHFEMYTSVGYLLNNNSKHT